MLMTFMLMRFRLYEYIKKPAAVMETQFWMIGVHNEQHMQLCFKPSKLSTGLTKQLNKDEDQEGKYFHWGMQNCEHLLPIRRFDFVNDDTEYLHLRFHRNVFIISSQC